MSKYSKTIAGCMSWGQWGKKLSTPKMVDLIHFCIENSITTFDHADIYGDYTTEAEFGKALKESHIVRENIQLISKCGIQYIGKSRSNKVKHYNYSKEYIVWSVEESLKNLQTEYLDLLLLHRPSPLMNPKEVSEAIQQLKNEGKIRDFGLSNFTPSQTELIKSKEEVLVNQIEVSLTQFSAMLDDSLQYMQLNKIQPMIWSPLGKYFKEKNDQNTRIKNELENLCKKYGVTESQLLLAWLYKHPVNMIPVIGTTNKDRIIESVKAQSIELELEDWFALLVASQGHKVP
ncbi:Predicted oxidoreductase [Tenacibaculum sp. MAR_2009_124]|uniref:aldo/keto reductase n=1 Tax=Tenacibaculum sp. MAR_2009_124 TaxID=1250059 RepID=UPI00089D600C|nr:aldo/keto reductase [Tenacibaculum sp. MAR_2009_124]SEC53664.1 Predicted oxidoreductase [Tenacibaculum sp. MAR_2009_124]